MATDQRVDWQQRGSRQINTTRHSTPLVITSVQLNGTGRPVLVHRISVRDEKAVAELDVHGFVNMPTWRALQADTTIAEPVYSGARNGTSRTSTADTFPSASTAARSADRRTARRAPYRPTSRRPAPTPPEADTPAAAATTPTTTADRLQYGTRGLNPFQHKGLRPSFCHRTTLPATDLSRSK